MVTVKIDGKSYDFDFGVTYGEIAKSVQKNYARDILLAEQGTRLRELDMPVGEDCEIRFLTMEDRPGFEAYRRSALFLLMKAFFDVVGKKDASMLKVCFAVGNGIYLENRDGSPIPADILDQILSRMREITAEKIPVHKRSVDTEDAIELFHRHHMYDKERLFHFRMASRVNIYSIEDYEDYYYGYMVPDTGYIRVYDLVPYGQGFVLLLPTRRDPDHIGEFQPSRKLFVIQKKSEEMSERTGVFDVGTFNEAVSQGRIDDIILMQEALQEKQIGDIAEKIMQAGRRIVMIAGPSSSSKTSFSHRLSIQLAAHGLSPHPIAVDDYFLNRADTPKDEKGNYDFESIDALDRKQLNHDLTALLSGDKIEMPHYNFVTGEREYKGDTLQIGKQDVLVIEGIHCLNDKLSYAIPKDDKFRIYISALTQLNVDEHNRIPTTDGRLIRRMVRDARTRGNDARMTIRMWDSVRRGEERNIFPFQDSADVMFNSALLYELPVLKQFAEPLLYNVPRDCPEYTEAKRLLKFLDYFLGVSSEHVPNNSLLREFIGGSCFNV